MAFYHYNIGISVQYTLAIPQHLHSKHAHKTSNKQEVQVCKM